MKKKLGMIICMILLLLPVLEAHAIIWQLPDRSWHSRTIYVIHVGGGGGGGSGTPTPRIKEAKLALVAGRTHKLGLDGAGKGKVKWSSSNPSVATVSSSGTITALKKGKAKITAKVNDKTARCEVTVSSKVYAKSIKLTKINHIMLVGESQYVDYKISPAEERITEEYSVTWGTSDPKVIDVDKTGKITVKSQGSAVISAKLTWKKGKTKTVSMPIRTETGLTRFNKWIKSQGYSFADGGNSIRKENGKWLFRTEDTDTRYPVVAEMTISDRFSGKARLYIKGLDWNGNLWYEGTSEADFHTMYHHSKHTWDFSTLNGISRYSASDMANAMMAVLRSNFQLVLRDQAKLLWTDLGMPYNDY